MSEQTAMEQLDEAVRRFAREGSEREGVVTTWVLLHATSRYADDGELWEAYDYAVSPTGTMAGAVGLLHLAWERIKRHLARGDDGDA